MNVPHPHPHPLALVSLAAWLHALTQPFIAFGLQITPRSVLAAGLLASTFAILVAGHWLVRGSWRMHLVLAAANAPLLFAWSMALVAMWMFPLGLAGALVLGALLSVPAMLLVCVLRRKSRGRASTA